MLLRGLFEVRWADIAHRVGPRADVFSGYPHAVYLPAGHALQDRRRAGVRDRRLPRVVVASARAWRRGSSGPEDCGFEIRGGGNATRQIVDIVPPAFPADRLLLCEVFTPGGNWSSYPPHKHDTDDPPREVDLDEVYYFRFRDRDGYGFQRVYTERRDETLRVTHGDVVAVRDGYHPFVTAHGYDAYYLNVLAGERRSMAASDDPALRADSGAHGRRPIRGCRWCRRPRVRVHNDRSHFWRTFMKRTLHGMLALIAVFLLHVPGAFAQVDRATLSGVVRDSGGGVVPGATVTVTNLATNVESHQATTETGGYQVVNLMPGRYQVDVELSGFKKSSQVITLEVGQRARLDVELAVGSFSETVTVAESSQLLNTNDATLGAVIPQMQVANLPLAIRNWDDLLALVPGVQGDRYTEQGGGTSFGRTGGINVHGARALQNNFLLDGVDNNSISENVQELTSQVSRPSVDTIFFYVRVLRRLRIAVKCN